MCIYCLQLYLETSKSERRRRLPYIIFNFLIFALSATQAFVYSEVQFQRTFYSTSGLDVITDSRRLAFGRLPLTGMLCSCLVVFLADGLMVCPPNEATSSKIAKDTAVLSMLHDKIFRPIVATLATGTSVHPIYRYVFSIFKLIGDRLFSEAFGALTVAQYARPNDGIIAWPQPTFIWLTVIFNILVTVLITQRLLYSRKELREALPGRDMSPYNGVLAILIESAVPLSVTGIGYAILSAVSISGPGNPFVGVTFLNLFNLLYTSFNVSRSRPFRYCIERANHPPLQSQQLSPTLIIFRVTTGRSWTTHFEQTMKESGSSVIPGKGGQDMSLRFHHTTQGGEDLESVVSSVGIPRSPEIAEKKAATAQVSH